MNLIIDDEIFDKKKSFTLSDKCLIQPNLCALENEKSFVKN